VTVLLGSTALGFRSTDAVSGRPIDLSELRGKAGTVCLFLSNHCPFVRHVEKALVALATDYAPRGISFFAVNPTDVEQYPDDLPSKMKEYARKAGFPFPYLSDASQEVARGYGAVCTPDIFLFDRELACVYRGQLDDSRPSNGIPVTGRDLRAALDDLLAGRPIDPNQKSPIGCGIDWK
jgi:peroxiredoxin